MERALVKPSQTGYACLVASNRLGFTVTLEEGAEVGGAAPVDIEAAEVVTTAHSEEQSNNSLSPMQEEDAMVRGTVSEDEVL